MRGKKRALVLSSTLELKLDSLTLQCMVSADAAAGACSAGFGVRAATFHDSHRVMKLFYFGHSCFLVTLPPLCGGKRLLFDPFLTNNPKAREAGLDQAEAALTLFSNSGTRLHLPSPGAELSL
jgi:hypothetical protein